MYIFKNGILHKRKSTDGYPYNGVYYVDAECNCGMAFSYTVEDKPDDKDIVQYCTPCFGLDKP